MTFYEELQLNQAASKQLIKNAPTGKEKFRHSAIFLFKIILTLAFCMLFVMAYSIFFGKDNSILGVVVLLCVLVFRNADLGFHAPHAVLALLGIFIVLALGPHLANTDNLFLSVIIHLVSIGLIMFLGCFDVMMFNHSTLVLGYLLLYGYDVSGISYINRLLGITLGALIVCVIYYRNHRKRKYDAKFRDLFHTFDIHSFRTQWQLLVTATVTTVLFLAVCFHFIRPMWAGITSMSVLVPYNDHVRTRTLERIRGCILGVILFFLIYTFFPNSLYKNIGLLAGFCVGLSATYGTQVIFNTFGALSVATNLFGVSTAIFYRLLTNIFGGIFGVIFEIIFYLFAKKGKGE